MAYKIQTESIDVKAFEIYEHSESPLWAYAFQSLGYGYSFCVPWTFVSTSTKVTSTKLLIPLGRVTEFGLPSTKKRLSPQLKELESDGHLVLHDRPRTYSSEHLCHRVKDKSLFGGERQSAGGAR